MDKERANNRDKTSDMNGLLAGNNAENSRLASDLIEKFEQVVRKIDESGWKQAIAEAAKTYHLKNYNIQRLNPQKIMGLYRTVAFKYMDNLRRFYNSEKNKSTWHQNELRIFVWLLLTYSHMIRTPLESFNKSHWEFLTGFFMGKTTSLCEFQYRNLKRICEKSDRWVSEEDQLLENILNQSPDRNKWNQIAKQIFYRSSHKFFRTAKQCRERWNNYLDPFKNKGNWAPEQDLSLLKCVLQKGKKWSLIAKMMENTRTEHMVKNRYKSLISKHAKKLKKRQITETDLLHKIQKQLQKTIQRAHEDTKKEGGTQPSLEQHEQKKKDETLVLSPAPLSAFSKMSMISDSFRAEDDQQRQPTFQCVGVKTPSLMLFSPMPPPILTPGFSPYPEPGRGRIYYESQKTPRHDLTGLMPCNNYFSFDNLKK